MLNGIGDVEDKLVVTADVMTCESVADIDGRCLPCAFEMKQRATVRIWVGYRQMKSVPSIAAVSGNVGIASVVGIEAMRHRDRLPCCNLFAVPDLP